MARVEKKVRERGTQSSPCPDCGGNSRVIKTYRRDGATWRLRECVSCESRFETTEKVSS